MTTNIRSSVFETNSSSTHSVSLKFSGVTKGMLLETVNLNAKGQIVLDGGDFASTEIYVEDTLTKLNFIATYIIVYGNELLQERFEKIVKEQTGASEILFNMRLVYSNGKPANTFFSPEYSNPYDYHEDDEDEDEDNEDNDDDEEVNNKCSEISLKDILKSNSKLRAFLFSKRSNITSEISYG